MAVGLIALSACQPAGAPPQLRASAVHVPQRVHCGAADAGALHCAGLHAALFVSGYLDPDAGGCALDVNPVDCTVTGDCPAVTPAERRMVLDYFYLLDGGARGAVRTVVAQAQKHVDLRGSAAELAGVAFTDADLVDMDRCEQMPGCSNASQQCALSSSVPARDGGVRLAGVCDLNGNGRSNLEDLCALRDPLP